MPYPAENDSVKLELLIPVVGMIVLVVYFAIESASDDPWGRKKSDQ